MRFAILAAAFIMIPASTLAQDLDVQIRAALDLRRTGHDDDAVTAFAHIYAATSSPRALAQLGFAEQAVGRWVDAAEHLERATTLDDTWISEHRDALDVALTTVRQRVGTLDVRCNVPSAEVRVDGRVVTATPVRLLAGIRAIEVAAHGYVTDTRTVAILPAGVAVESVDLVPVQTPVAVSISTLHPTPPITVPVIRHTNPGIGPWLVMGGGAAAMATAGILGALRANVLAGCRVSGDDAFCPTPAALEQARMAPTYATAGNIALGLGSAMVAGGFLWWALAPRTTTRVTLGMSAISIEGSF